MAGKIAEINAMMCEDSGRCFEECRFEAVKKVDGTYEIDSLACEGCGVCAFVCPLGAITMHEVQSGELFQSSTPYGLLVHAALKPGRENSGKLVTFVRDTALERARQTSAGTILIDGSPGIGCPVIATLSGVDLALVVTEPTPTGLQGMERVMAVARHFAVPSVVCINKIDLNPALARQMESCCAEVGSPVIGRIPFDRAVVEANVRRMPVVETAPSKVVEALKELATTVQSRLYQKWGTREP